MYCHNYNLITKRNLSTFIFYVFQKQMYDKATEQAPSAEELRYVEGEGQSPDNTPSDGKQQKLYVNIK